MRRLIVVSGLPGAGKSTLAGSLADALDATVLVKDVIEASLWRRGVGREQESFLVAHEVMTALAAHELSRGRTVVLDTVATTEKVRTDWRRLAQSAGARFLIIVCVCRDEGEHRRRLEGRTRGIPGWPELTWTDVEKVRARFEPWADEHLTLDSMESVAENLRRAIAYVD